MVNDSDTESEPESSVPKCSAIDFAQAYDQRDRHDSDGTNSAQNAAATLQSLDLESVQNVCPPSNHTHRRDNLLDL